MVRHALGERGIVGADMAGRTALVTGATSGIGKATALGLARHGATVFILARSAERGEATAAELRARSGNLAVECVQADLSSMQAVRLLAEGLSKRLPRLHVLINVAGVYKAKREVTAEGLEVMLATNHLGPFLLTTLLLDALKAGRPSSIFTVTAPSTVRLNFADLQAESQFNPLTAFGVTKTANLLFTFALARRLEGSEVGANAYHPGVTRTSLMREAPVPMRLLLRLGRTFARTPEKAAEGLVHLAATNADGISGELFHDRKIIAAPQYSRDREAQDRLWQESLALTAQSPAP